jgi:hypothetical protein
MVYRRLDKKSGKLRPGWTFKARTQTRWIQLHDLWVTTRYDVHEIRRLLNDVDIGRLVEEWHAVYAIHAIPRIGTKTPRIVTNQVLRTLAGNRSRSPGPSATPCPPDAVAFDPRLLIHATEG